MFLHLLVLYYHDFVNCHPLVSLITTRNCRLLHVIISLQLWTFRTINEIISFTVSSAFNFFIDFSVPWKRKIYHDTILIYLQIISLFWLSLIFSYLRMTFMLQFQNYHFYFVLVLSQKDVWAIVLIYLVSPLVHAWGLVMLWCFFSFLGMSCRYWLFARSWTLPSIIFQLLSRHHCWRDLRTWFSILSFSCQDGFCLYLGFSIFFMCLYKDR